jgi:hypothetical protein
MADKHKLHHYYRILKQISFWHLLTLTIVFSVIAALALRQNNLTAIKLRDHVLQVDKDNGAVDTALNQLRTYIYNHMNANLDTGTSVYPPIQLKYRYDRLVAAEQDRVNKLSGNVYSEAQKYCEQQNSKDFSGRNRVPCIQEYVTSHGGVQPNPIPDALYKFDFVSPIWSPDLAGFSLLIAGFFAMLTVIRLALSYWLKSILSEH